jgi:hypothetical protein
MLYLLLTVIAIILFLIYKNQNQIRLPLSAQETMKFLLSDIVVEEESFLHNINNNHLKDHMDNRIALFDNAKKNFVRLCARYKHNDSEYQKIANDWLDWIKYSNESVTNTQLIDLCHDQSELDVLNTKEDDLDMKIGEIEKRFEALLGKDYLDPLRVLFPNMKEEDILKLKHK